MISENVYNNYLDHLLGGRRAQCACIVQELLDQEIAIKDLYSGLFQESLYETGRLWEMNKISVAREHLVTAITEGLMNLVYPALFGKEKNGKSAVVSCVPNEPHRVGAKMASDVFELHGWSVYFLGADTPIDDLLRFVDRVKPDLVGLSCSAYFNIPNLILSIEALKAEFASLDIAVGGRALAIENLDSINKYPNTMCIHSLPELEDMLQSSCFVVA